MQLHGNSCIWVDEYYLGEAAQEYNRSCISADEVDEDNQDDVLPSHRRAWVDEYNPEELRQHKTEKAHWLALVGCWGCGIVMGLLLFIVLMLFVDIIA